LNLRPLGPELSQGSFAEEPQSGEIAENGNDTAGLSRSKTSDEDPQNGVSRPLFPLSGRILGPHLVPRVSGDDQGFASTREVAEILGLSRSAVYRLCKSGQIPSVQVKSVIRIPAQSFNELMARIVSGSSGSNSIPNPEGAP
jgi:excisionase family DNA binding protein